MKVLFKVDGDGNGYVAALDASNVDSTVAEHRKAATVPKGQEIELDFPDVLSADQIGFGDVTSSESGDVVTETPGSDEGESPADKPGGGNEGSPAAAGSHQGQVDGEPGGSPDPGTPADQTTDPSSPGADAGGGEGGQQPTGDGDLGGTQAGEQATTSAASEKPLYLVDTSEGAIDAPEGFEPSGLETPEGRTLFHFESDTAGQAATGNRDGVSTYADADDNEKPVQPATPAEGQETTTTA